MPGTGKTASTLEVIRRMQPRLDFDFIHINAMSLTNPYLVYTVIYEAIVGRRVSPAVAAFHLKEYFTNGKQKSGRMWVVLIDELDSLLIGKQTILYNLFDWPCYKKSNLVILAIANTMDLPERLNSKVSSRIGKNRLVYSPYTSQEILTILRS
jgi:origin recognition complex subunit 1